MSEALGGFVYSLPIERNEDDWYGRIQSVGPEVTKFTTYIICNYITYKNSDIVESLNYNGRIVHKLWYENIIKIEGVY